MCIRDRFILLGILYIFHLKREIRRIIEWIEHNEHIYSVNVLDKDIENLALSINKRIKEDERKEHQLKKQDKNFKKMVANLSHDLSLIHIYPESQIKVYLRNVIKVFGYNKNISDITKELVYGGVGVEKIGYEGEDLEEYYTNLLSEVKSNETA